MRWRPISGRLSQVRPPEKGCSTMIDRKILHNISYLGLTNVANLIIPLVVLPFITRVLGPTQFGQYAWAVSAGTLLGLVCDFGFNWSAAREVAIHKEDRRRTAAIVAEAYAVRALLFTLTGLVLFAVWSQLPHGDGVGAVLSFVPLIAFCNLLTPPWLFQGLEQFRIVVFSSMFGRLTGVIGIFALVREPADAGLAIMLTAAGAVLPGLVTFRFLARHYGDVLRLPTRAAVGARLQSAWRIFTADLVIQVYTMAQTFLVGLLGGPVAAAQYNIGDRCLNAGKGFLAAITQAAMPRVANLAVTDPAAGMRLIRKVMLMVGCVGLAGGLVMGFAADLLVMVAFGPDFMESARVLRILAPVPILVGVGSCFSSLYMFNYGEGKLWSMMLKMAAAINFGTMFGLHLLGVDMHIAAPIAVVAAESFVFCLAGYRFLLAVRLGK